MNLHEYNLITVLFRLLLSCVCGATVGLERTKRLKEAGIRTHCIIASAAALLMLVSQYGFTEMLTENGLVGGSRGADSARIAAQVVSGISFLGAGVIFKNGNAVKGLTTAAGIWATAGIGLAIGCGMYIPGIVLTILVVIVQLIFHRYSIGNDAYAESEMHITAVATAEFKAKILLEIQSHNIQLLNLKIDQKDDGCYYTLSFRPKHDYAAIEIAELLDKYPEIKSISVTC